MAHIEQRAMAEGIEGLGIEPAQADDTLRPFLQSAEEERQATLDELRGAENKCKKCAEALVAAQSEAKTFAEEKYRHMEATCKAEVDASVPESMDNFKELRAALHRCSIADAQAADGGAQAIQELESALLEAHAVGADARQLDRFERTLASAHEVFELFVRTLNGNEYRVDVAGFHSVGNVRERVASGLGWDNKATRLFSEGVQLTRDQDTLKQYGVTAVNKEVFARLLVDEVEDQSGAAKASVDSALNDLVSAGARQNDIQFATAALAMDKIHRAWTQALINVAAASDTIDLSEIALLLHQLDEGLCTDDNAREIVRLYADGAPFVKDIDEEYTRKIAAEKENAMVCFEATKKHIQTRKDQEYWSNLYAEQNALGLIRMSQVAAQSQRRVNDW